MARFFKTVTGAPTGKVEAFTAIAGETKIAFGNILAIGDSTTEYEAAKSLAMPFAGIVQENQSNPFPDTVSVFTDLAHLNSTWN